MIRPVLKVFGFPHTESQARVVVSVAQREVGMGFSTHDLTNVLLLGTRTVRRSLCRLEDTGVLLRTTEYGNRGQRTLWYRVNSWYWEAQLTPQAWSVLSVMGG